jgi:hypothetical protein
MTQPAVVRSPARPAASTGQAERAVSTACKLACHGAHRTGTPSCAPAATQPDPLRAAGRWPAAVAYAAGTISVALGVAAGAVLSSLTGALLR